MTTTQKTTGQVTTRILAVAPLVAIVAFLATLSQNGVAQSDPVCDPTDGASALMCEELPDVTPEMTPEVTAEPQTVISTTVEPEEPEVVSDALAIELAVDQRLVLPTDRDALVMIQLTGSDSADTARLPVSLAIVIDGSGSMRGDKIDDARDAARELVDELEPGDVLTVISYNESATTHLDRFEIGDSRRDAHSAIRHIRARGNTCISCGLDAAYTALRDAPTDHVRRVVMLSDGNANRGNTLADGLEQQAADAVRMNHTPTSTIGLGSDYNEDLMTAISAGGTGHYYFLPEASAMGAILDRELAALASTVALGVVLEVHPEDDVTIGETDIAGAHRDGVDLVINLGQISAGEERRILVPLGLPEGELGQIVSTRITFRDVSGLDGDLERAAEIGRTDDAATAASTRDARVAELAERWASAADLEAAMVELTRGDQEGAARRLRSRSNNLREQAAALGSAELSAEAEAVDELLDAIEEEDVDAPRARQLFLQNQARSNEVRSGAAPAEMYHQDTVQ